MNLQSHLDEQRVHYRMGGIRFLVLSLLIWQLALPQLVWANGYYKSSIAHPAAPTIPVQRAMIIHRDGVQTLIVESTYQTDSTKVGWILPLPSEPTALDRADASVLRSLSECLRPIVIAQARDARSLLGMLLVFVAGMSLVAIVGRRESRLVLLLAALPVMVLLAAIMLPSLNRSRDAGELTLLGATRRVGSYDVQVLRAGNADALGHWLSEHGLHPLTEPERKVFGDYAARGWCFAAARLTHEPDGRPATPHPIAATFAAHTPVFPMHATSLAGSETMVELYVISDAKASANGFQCVVSDRFKRTRGEHLPSTQAGLAPWMQSDATELIIGHPDAISRMGDSCILTKLSATLKPEDMDRDVAVSMTPFEGPVRQRLYSSRARLDYAMSAAYAGGILLAVVAGVAFKHRARPRRGHVAVLGGMLLATAGAVAVIYTRIPVTEVVEASRVRGVSDRSHLRRQVQSLDRAIRNGAAAPRSADDLTRIDPEVFEFNAFTHAPFQPERSPGNFELRKLDHGAVFCFYDEWFREIRIPLGDPRDTTPSEH